MTALFARRLLRLLASLFLLAVASFGMIRVLPGDPVRAALGTTASSAQVAAERHSLGLTGPLLDQFMHFLGGILHGNLGTSIAEQLPVSTIIGQRLPATLQIAGLAFLLVLLIAIPIGVAAGIATREDRRPRLEAGFGVATGVFTAIPEFVLAIGLVFVFAVTLPWLPPAGQSGPASYILPVAALAAGPAAALSRIVRVETQRVLAQDYIRTARAKRLAPAVIYIRHALPNALVASLTIGGLLLGGLIAGTVLVETVFSWPGVGLTFVQAVEAKDYPLVQGLVLVFGTLVLVINLVVDLVLIAVDPRTALGAR